MIASSTREWPAKPLIQWKSAVSSDISWRREIRRPGNGESALARRRGMESKKPAVEAGAGTDMLPSHDREPTPRPDHGGDRVVTGPMSVLIDACECYERRGAIGHRSHLPPKIRAPARHFARDDGGTRIRDRGVAGRKGHKLPGMGVKATTEREISRAVRRGGIGELPARHALAEGTDPGGERRSLRQV